MTIARAAAAEYRRQMSARHVVSLLLFLSTALAAVGCKDKAPGPEATASATPSASAATPTTAAKPWKDPSEDPSPAPSGVLPTGTPVSANTLASFDLPQPKKAPAGALWTSVWAEKPGDRFTNLVEFTKKPEGKKYWMSIRMIDCRDEKAKAFVGKPLKDAGQFQYCFVTLPTMLKGNPSFGREKGGGNNAVWDAMRVVRAGNVIVTALPGAEGKWKLAELDEALADMDWATISKW